MLWWGGTPGSLGCRAPGACVGPANCGGQPGGSVLVPCRHPPAPSGRRKPQGQGGPFGLSLGGWFSFQRACFISDRRQKTQKPACPQALKRDGLVLCSGGLQSLEGFQGHPSSCCRSVLPSQTPHPAQGLPVALCCPPAWSVLKGWLVLAAQTKSPTPPLLPLPFPLRQALPHVDLGPCPSLSQHWLYGTLTAGPPVTSPLD